MSQIKLLTLGETLDEAGGGGSGAGSARLPLPLGFGEALPPGADTDFIRHRRARLWQAVWARLQGKITLRVPLGYQDETGFHYGPRPAETIFGPRLMK